MNEYEIKCRAFLRANDVRLPDFRFEHGPINCYGRYLRHQEAVIVYTNRCRIGSRYGSYPGFWEDLSVYGVLAHECGHHVEHVRGWGVTINNRYYDAYMKEKPLSFNATMDRHEDFADSITLFITNPTLLAEACPRRYAFMLDELQMTPTEARHWREILGDSPAHIHLVQERLR